MNFIPPDIVKDEELLGPLAMQFRRAEDGAERREVANRYADAVGRLIRSGMWHEAPPPEDQLPDADMPRSFFEFCRNYAVGERTL